MSTSAERMTRLRERRRAELEAVPQERPGDDGPLLAGAVRESVAGLELGPRFAACSALALRVASAIDDAPSPAVLRALGPLLLRVLGELGATPAARAKLKRKPEPARPLPRLDEFRAQWGRGDAARQRAAR